MTEIDRLLSEGFITEDFLKEEERCGYVVSSEMKKVWAIQMDLMVKLFEVCKRHNLRIWTCGGTMLGAVRHSGFIPWDDDSDFFLPRDDYEKLIRLPREEFPEPYFLQSEFTDADNNMYTTYAKFCNSNTTVDVHACGKEKVTWNSGIFVDIIPLDGISNSKIKLFFQTKLIKFFTVAHHVYALGLNSTFLIKLLCKVLHCPIIKYNSYSAIRRINRLAGSKAYKKAGRVGQIMIPMDHYYALNKLIYEKSDWNETIWLAFETIKVPCPVGYDRILKTAFGDYLQFPPIEKRGKWHNIDFHAEIPYKEYYQYKPTTTR